MTGRIKISGVEFQPAAVPGRLAEAILSDPTILRGIWRDVYRWDARGGTGQVLVPVKPDNAVPLGNALAFFIPKATPTGILGKNEAASQRMAERFMSLVEAQGPGEVVRALGEILRQPQKVLPLAEFAPLNPIASYVVRMHVSYAIVQLRHAGEDLSAYLCLPSRVSFHHEVEAIPDEAAYHAAIAADRGLRAVSVSFVVPAKSAANADLRKLALRKRIEEYRAMIAAPGHLGSAAAGAQLDSVRDRLALAEEEWDALA
ncbi:MAG: hypothetical protein GC146_16590 [Limimaricola sp.]|uniref:hypothetical protein n=1 Tax=Limimaricola sp. TaxID=2211665 RepID=UPI001D22718D|nr:hypothetical protein [Limimaricola sp.]MBI1418836.1 hypothetical protein [Limimaricola sp.]